ncbi:hypothetical protein KKC88_05035 [Patescibacteria group bacterium]|nr:hypothetical protein [Patescibacteria group bacterium]MBU1673691.1 hypothetical protein [Patescibacteria group bacterium]MBU1963080.1 hypothetical protein [Patescibacteria group bacterium]
MRKFKCQKCDAVFEAEGEKIEKENQIYGKVWNWQAMHDCGQSCDEYIAPKVKIKKKPKASGCSGQCATCPYQGH